MYRQYREIKKGEFFVVGGDCAQGGSDRNAAHFFSKTNLDIPLVYHAEGVAAQMTDKLYPVLEKLFDITGIKPVVGLERNNGGASEMNRLEALNRLQKYTLYIMPTIGKTDEKTPEDTGILGYNMTGASRPSAVGDLKHAVDNKLFKIYDKETIKELYAFIINKQGKPEARKGAHDDLVMALAVTWQMYQTCQQPLTNEQIEQAIDELPVETWRGSGGFY